MTLRPVPTWPTQWINSLLDTPEMIIYASCTKREHAEMIERALINRFDVSNTNHNFKFVGWRTEDSDRDPDPPPDDIPY